MSENPLNKILYVEDDADIQTVEHMLRAEGLADVFKNDVRFWHRISS